MTGSASAQGVPTAAVKVVEGSGEEGPKLSDSAPFWHIFPTYPDDGKRFSAGSSYGSREGGGGFGGRRDQKYWNRRPIGASWRMTGSAPAQGVPTAAVKVVGGSGGGGTKKVRFRAPLGSFPRFPKGPWRCRGTSFFEK